MTAKDFRRIALSLEGAEESSHMGAPDFRVGGHIFATLASERQGYGNLMLTPEQQARSSRNCRKSSCQLPVDGEGWARPTSAWPWPPRTFWKAPCAPHGSSGWRRTPSRVRRKLPGNDEWHPPRVSATTTAEGVKSRKRGKGIH